MDEGTDEERDIYAGDKHPGYFKTWHRHRKQMYDRRSQYVSYTHNYLKGHKLPMLAKFPRISDFFEIIPPEHSWSNHRPGIFNGIFIVPDTQPHHFSIPDITINGKDYTASFFGSFRYRLLLEAFNLVYRKLSIGEGGSVSKNIANMGEDFSQHPTLIKYSK